MHYQQPDASGHFGPYGGSFVSETLVHALDELKAAYGHYRNGILLTPVTAQRVADEILS